jgi:hypothetical protein
MTERKVIAYTSGHAHGWKQVFRASECSDYPRLIRLRANQKPHWGSSTVFEALRSITLALSIMERCIY